MKYLVVTPAVGKKGDMILRPAHFFCCVNACPHGYLPRNWYGDRRQPVILPPRDVQLEDKALYLAEVEQRDTYGIAKSLRSLAVTGGTQWDVTLGLTDEVRASKAAKITWESWNARRHDIFRTNKLPSLALEPTDYAEQGLVLSPAGENKVQHWQDAAKVITDQINANLATIGPEPPFSFPYTLVVTWKHAVVNVLDIPVTPWYTTTVKQVPVPTPALLHLNPNVLLRLYGVLAEQWTSLDAAVSGYQSDLSVEWLTVTREDIVALFGSLPDDCPATVELRPAHVGGIAGPYVYWEGDDGAEYHYAHRGGTGYHYREIWTGPAGGWEDVSGLDWAGDSIGY